MKIKILFPVFIILVIINCKDKSSEPDIDPAHDFRLMGNWRTQGYDINGVPRPIDTYHWGFIFDEDVDSSGHIYYPCYARTSYENNIYWGLWRTDGSELIVIDIPDHFITFGDTVVIDYNVDDYNLDISYEYNNINHNVFLTRDYTNYN